MTECDDGACMTAPPAEQARLRQAILRGSDQELVVHGHSFLGVLMRTEKMRCQRTQVRERIPALDHARFIVGIIGLYEAVPSEPVPQRMLRLIEEIRKQEKS